MISSFYVLYMYVDSSLVSGSASLPERPSAPDLQPTSRLVTRRLKDPLDMTNPDYEQYLEEKAHKPVTDFISTNKVSTPTYNVLLA